MTYEEKIWAKITDVFLDIDLTANEKIVTLALIWLCHHNKSIDIRAPRHYLSQVTSLSKKTTIRATQSLVLKDLLKVKNSYEEDGAFSANIYSIELD